MQHPTGSTMRPAGPDAAQIALLDARLAAAVGVATEGADDLTSLLLLVEGAAMLLNLGLGRASACGLDREVIDAVVALHKVRAAAERELQP